MNHSHFPRLIFLLWLLSPVVVGAAEFQFQHPRLPASVSPEAIDTLIQHNYSTMDDLKSLSFKQLLPSSVKGRSALLLVEQFIDNQAAALVKPLNTSPPTGWQAVKNLLDEIFTKQRVLMQTMRKDLYEKTSEFQARRQAAIDQFDNVRNKFIEQINTAAQQGDSAYQAATATIKNYDADAERLDFEIEWLDPFQSLVEGTTEMKSGSIRLVPAEARTFSLGKSFPLFSSVRWTNNRLHKIHLWLGSAVKTYYLVGFSSFRQISAGGEHTCGLHADGTVVCWGDYLYGQSTPPTGSFSQVSAGAVHTCGLRTDSTMTCWGNSQKGRSSPPLGSFSQVSAGESHSCGRRTDSTVACWGDDNHGRSTPPLGSFSQVSAGGSHSCGLRTANTVACWGYNNHGRSSPLTGNFSQVSAGGRHTCGLRTDGTVACWGDNGSGQSTPPTGSFFQVSAGDSHTCGLRLDGTAACWGYNGSGQSTPPTGRFSQVSAGYRHTCGVHIDGTVACWGNNSKGQSTPPVDK